MVTKLSLNSIHTKSFVDIPSSKPAVRFALPQVGITNRPCYVQVQDPFVGKISRLFGKLGVSFGLPADQRGVHMSRIEECLSNMPALPISDWIEQFSDSLTARQELPTCSVQLDLQCAKSTNKNLSEILSEELIELHSAIERNVDGTEICAGLTVPFINACPCTQRWGMREFYQELIAQGFVEEKAESIMRKAPLQAHTNLGKASLKIWSRRVDHHTLYNVLNRAVPIVRELLKGIDEHVLVKHAHREGQFCEDNARAIVQEVFNEFDGKLDDTALVEIVVEVEESVHFHNLRSQVRCPFGDLKRNLTEQPAD